jgi:transcriptional regulator with XRE-family HTH domain
MTANIHAGVASGKFRQPWRIREFLSAKNLTMMDIAKELDKPHSTVSRTIQGTLNNRQVLAWLRDLGVPEKYLSLPEDLAL